MHARFWAGWLLFNALLAGLAAAWLNPSGAALAVCLLNLGAFLTMMPAAFREHRKLRRGSK